MRRSLPPLLAVTAMLVAVPAAGAHSLIRVADGVASYLSADEVSLNTLTVTRVGVEIEFRDPTAYQGSDIGPCRPGDTTDDGNAFVIQAFCPAEGVTRVRIDLGNREDSATVTPGVPAEVLGGDGADTLATGDPADVVDGGLGNDRIAAGGGADVVTGGAGVDDVDAGDGDDDVRVRDGLADSVLCGAGADRVEADSVDAVAGDCEVIARAETAPPPEAGATATDKTPPVVDAGAVTLQRLGRRGVVRVAATSSERGTLGASGYIDVAGVRIPLGNVNRPVSVGGGGADLALRISGRPLREARRALKRKRRVTVHLSVVATDAAGNSAQKRVPRIRIVR